MANASAAISQEQEQERLALVSSLYGLGNVTCWYLTILSLLVTWTLHPRKRKAGTVEVDLIAILTLPTVANGHFVTQVQNLLDQSRGAPSSIDGKYAQLVAALEAPCVILDIFAPVVAVLSFAIINIKCKRRNVLINIVGFSSFAVWCYVHFSRFAELGLKYDPTVPSTTHGRPKFTRFFAANFPKLSVGIIMTVLLGYLIWAIMHLLVPDLPWSPFPNTAGRKSDLQRKPPEQRVHSQRQALSSRGLQRLRTVHNQMAEGSSFAMALSLMSVVLVQCFTMLHLSSISHDSVVSARTSRQKLKKYAARMFGNVFPRTPCSIMDLDQAVAATAGVSILAFRIYGVAKARYEIWKNKTVLPVASRVPDGTTTGAGNDGIELEPRSP